MQKLVKMLEDKVEWLAVALGGLFLLWMVWGNVINPPGAVQMGGKTLAAGDVDRSIAEGPAQRVEAAMSGHGTLPSGWAPHSFVGDFASTLNATTKPTTVLAFAGVQRSVVPPEEPAPPIPGIQPPLQGQTPNGVALASLKPVDKLPVLPPAQPFGVLTGMSSVMPLPGQVTVAMTAGSANGQPQAVDKPWASVSFKVPSGQIASAFKAARIPGALKTLFLSLEAVRQEQMPDGTWGNETVVKSPAVQNQPPYPMAGLPPIAARQAEATYLQWARSNESQVIQPAFYQVTAGTTWHVPGFDVPKSNVPFNPSTVRPQDVASLPPDEKKQYMDWKQQQQQQLARQRIQQEQQRRSQPGPRGGGGYRGGPPPVGGGGPGGGGDTGFAPRPVHGSAAGAETSYQARPLFRPPQPVGAQQPMGDDMGDMGDQGMYGAGPQFQAGQLTPDQQKQLLAPTTDFDPAQFDQIIVWVNDDSVEPGKNYRYRLRYHMLNPIYQVMNVAVNNDLMMKFDLVNNEKSASWSSEADVPARTQFFVRQGIAGDAVTFDVYNFQNGQLWSKVLRVPVGDVIGSPDGNVDYTTPWTVADIRNDGRGTTYALLVDPYGRIQRRDVNTDRDNQAYRDLQTQYMQQVAQQRQQSGLPPLPAGVSPYGR